MITTKSGLSGEDKVIVTCVALLTLLTIVALIAISVVPSQTNTIIPVMAGTVIAISSLAARHPPNASTTAPVAVAIEPPQTVVEPPQISK